MRLKYGVSPIAIAICSVIALPAMAQVSDQPATSQEPAAQATPPADPQSDPAASIATPSADPAPAREDAIVVTGTRIVRPNLKTASPVTSVTSNEIRQQGAVNVEEVLNRLPQVTPDAQQNYQDSNGAQRVALRRLDFNRTLTLIDGQRMASTESVDLNIIPIPLVERIDVLSGGASSVYGSDAVAGVLNFVLKKDFNGLQINGNYNFFNHENRSTLVSPVSSAAGLSEPRGLTNDGARFDVNAAFGHNYLDGRLNISGYVGYRQASPIYFRDRDYSNCQLQRTTGTGLGCIFSDYSPNGNITPQSGANAGQSFANIDDGSRTFAPYANNAYGYNSNGDRTFQRQDKRLNGGAFVNYEISPAAEVYATFLGLRDRSENVFSGPVIQDYNGYGSTPYQVNCNNPLLSIQQASTICGAQAGTGALAPVNVLYRFPGLGGNGQADQYVNTALRFTGGVRGKFADVWHYDVGGVYTRSTNRWTTDPSPNFMKVNRALNVVNVNGSPTCQSVVDGSDPSCVPLDVFRANSGSTALRDYLFNEPRAISYNIGKLIDFTANVTGDLGKYGIKTPFAEQGLAVAFGVEYRELRQHNTVNQAFIDTYGGSEFTARQRTKEANVEAQLPVVEKKPFIHLLQVNGGYRLSKYNTNPDTFPTWKVELLYSPTPDITFRAAKNRAQRAPTVYEGNQTIGFSAANINDPCAATPDPTNPNAVIPARASLEACRATGLTGPLEALYNTTALSCPDQSCTERRGGFTLQPEDARTRTYGVVLTPRFLPGFTFSADRYEIKIDNIIGFNYSNFAIDGCTATALPYYCDRFVRNSSGTLYSAPGTTPDAGFIQAGTTNQYRLDARGWDFQAQYSVPVALIAGKLDFLFNGSLATYSGGQDSIITEPRNCVGYFGPRCGQPVPEWTHSLRGTYTTDDGFFSTSLNWRYISPVNTTLNSDDPGIGYTDADRITTFTRINGYSFFDLSMNFAIQKRMSFRVAVNNIFDKLPPLIPNSYDISLSRGNTIPQRYDALGRAVSIGFTTNF